MIKDLTQGAPGKVLLRYSLPLFGSIIFQQLYNIADSFVAGRYIGTAALSAVGNAYELTLVYIAFAFGCNIGTSVVVARQFGCRDYRAVKTSVNTSLVASGVIGALLTALGLALAPLLLRLIQTPQEIFADSLEYLVIYVGGFLFVLFYNIATGVFSALGDSRTPFLFLAVSSVSNVFVDILFVREFHMGVAGVAWATFLCQGVSGVAALLLMLRRVRSIHSDEPARAFDWRALGQLARVAGPSILQQGFISVGNILVQSIINGFGIAATGGYAAAVKLNNMVVTSITALGNGMSNYTAQNAGAQRTDRIRQGYRSGIVLGCGMAVLFTALFLAFGGVFVGLFITDGNQEAAEIGRQFLRIVAPFYCVVATKLITDGVLRGANRMWMFMLATLTDLVIRVVCSALFSKPLGITGVWLSWPVGWVIGTALSVGLYWCAKKKNFRLAS